MNFRTKIQPNRLLDRGTCTAFNRPEARTCEHFEAGVDGWCKWTVRPLKGADGKAAKGRDGKAIFGPTGECYR